jgi:C4-dicarboxylate-specific signal transduction histidine kinase
VTVLEGLNAVVYVSRPVTGELLYLNEQCRRFCGPGPLRRVGDIQRRLESPSAVSQPFQPGAAPCEVRDAATGTWYLVDVRAIPWIDGDLAHLHVATDITAHKHTEQVARERQQQLDSTSRLIAVGEMASTLAHELNQPLAAILNYNTGCLELLQSGSTDIQALGEGIERSSEQAERAGRIVQQVREFIRTREPRLELCDFNAIVIEATRAIERDACRYSVHIESRLADGMPPVRADGVMLQQLLINLAKNAIEAMDTVPLGARELSLRTYADGEAVHLEIADRGAGLPAALKDNLFIPFFSTKPAGMGLGLQICRSVAEFHGARLSAAPRPGGGTLFHLILPPYRA